MALSGRKQKRILIALTIIAVTFLADALLSMGHNNWVFFLLPLFIALPAVRGPRRFVVPSVCTLLIIIGYFLSHTGERPIINIVNRSEGIIVIWIATVLIIRLDRTQAELSEAYGQLERRVDDRTAELSRVNIALDRLRILYESILASAGEGIYGIDRNGNHTTVNRAAVGMLGYEAAEIIGKRSHPIWHHTRADGSPYPAEECRIFATLKDGIVKTVTDEVFWKKDGTSFPVEYTVAPIMEEGEISGAVIIFRDITERRRAEDALRLSEARYRALHRDNPTMIFTLDKEWVILSVNPSAAEQLGYESAELEGRPVLMLFHEYDRPAVAEQLRTCLMNPYQTYRAPFRKRRKDGSLMWVEEVGQAVYDLKGELNVLIVCQDITERKKAEENLAKAAAELARSNRDLEQFAYVISHDLQAPLRSISSFAQILREDCGPGSNTDAAKHFDFIISGAARLQTMIDDILAYSRVGRGGGEMGIVDFDSALSQATENLLAAIKEKDAVITQDPLPTLRADQSQMVMMLQNLVGNAIKFSAGQPRVHVSAAMKGDEYVFSVRDNGIGIDPEQFGRLFTLFQRLHTQSEYPGTGVGLAICKRIVERHSGRIWVESAPGKGSTFYFTINAGEREA